jgi:hypothetical protein
MKFIAWWLLCSYMAVVHDIFLVAQEPQECEVGEDGSCLNTEHTKVVPNTDATMETTEKMDEPKIEIDKNCPDRGHIIRCTGAHLDLNKNGKLDRDELDSAIQGLPW